KGLAPLAPVWLVTRHQHVSEPDLKAPGAPGFGVQPQLYQSLEGSFRSRAAGGLVLPLPRTTGGETSPSDGGQDSGMDPQTCAGWLHALEQPQVGAHHLGIG